MKPIELTREQKVRLCELCRQFQLGLTIDNTRGDIFINEEFNRYTWLQLALFELPRRIFATNGAEHDEYNKTIVNRMWLDKVNPIDILWDYYQKEIESNVIDNGS